MPDLHDREADSHKPDLLLVICTLIAAAIIIPALWWARDNLGISEWIDAVLGTSRR